MLNEVKHPGHGGERTLFPFPTQIPFDFAQGKLFATLRMTTSLQGLVTPGMAEGRE